jgi:hypothetical protein
MLAGAAWLACPAISASLLSIDRTEFACADPLGFAGCESFAPQATNARHSIPKYAGCFL